MLPYLEDFFGNPSSGHQFGEEARNGVERARQQAATFINGHPSSVVFTSGGSESNNLAIWSAIQADPIKRHIISSQVEHASVLTPLAFLAEKYGYEVELLPVDRQGGLDLNRLRAALRPDTALVSLMGANNETGVVWPVAELSGICREKRVLFHCDAVQVAGKQVVDVEADQVDYLSLSGHKLYGPKGSGVLYVKRSAPISPMIMGSGQENGRRAGTENVTAIVGFGMACELAGREIEANRVHMADLRDRLEKDILASIPDVMVNGDSMPRLANTLNVSFAQCSSAALIQELDERGIAVSAHSACQSGDLDPSHVLTAMAVPEIYKHGTLRISLGRHTGQEDVEHLLEVLPELVARSRAGFAA